MTEDDSKEENSVCHGVTVRKAHTDEKYPVPPPTAEGDILLEEVLGKLRRVYLGRVQ